MLNITNKIQFQIPGIGSASGLIYIKNSLFIISDNSSFLYQYSILENQLQSIKLAASSRENIPKSLKPDFEAIAQKGDTLYLIGSGSTQNRNKIICYDLITENIKELDCSSFYQKLKEAAQILDDDFNIEGAFFNNQKWYFFQRGNGCNGQNGIFVVSDFEISANPEIQFHLILLPKIAHVTTSFTDAIVVENTIYFLASAEDTLSTYEDGTVLGSIIGKIDLITLTLEFTAQISSEQKFEGLTLYRKSPSQIDFLLCEDNDTEALHSNIYQLTLNQN